MKKRENKNKIPILNSDDDFIDAFKKNNDKLKKKIDGGDRKKRTSVNRHGVKVIDDISQTVFCEEQEEEVPDGENLDFEQLLAKSYKTSPKKLSGNPKPVPLKKRLKRYPPVEKQLDLHGFTAIGAQVKTSSFVNSCKEQGFFTVRIIVGKGLHSEDGPVLPDVVEDQIKLLKQQGQVLFYEWEKKKKNNSGAMIVYIKQFDRFDP